MAYTPLHLSFEDVAVGQQWESPARTLTESDIIRYAGLSGDFNAIHIDHEFARTTPYGRPVAHGILVLGMASGLGLYAPPMRTLALLALRDWQFKEPVFAGDTLRAKTTVVQVEPKSRGRRAVITWRREILNQADKIVQEGISVTLVAGRRGEG